MTTHDPRTWALQQLGLAEQPSRAPRDVVALGENSSGSLTIDELAAMMGASHATAAGVSVTPDAAMRVTTVYACVNLIAGAISTLPLSVYERTTGRNRVEVDHPYWWLFNEQPHTGWTSAAAWQYLIMSKLLYGDGFGELLRPSFGASRITGWRPLHPLAVTPFEQGGSVLYRVSESGRPVRVLDSADVIHVPSIGFDGLTSPSPITYAAREAAGAAIAAEAYTSKFFSGGAQFDFALKLDKDLKPSQYSDLRAAYAARVASGGRAPLILTGGIEPVQLSINSRDAEILATRQFGVEELCRVFGMPPQLIGHGKETAGWAGSSIEQLGLGFVRYALMPTLTLIAQELNRKLWPIRERFFLAHDTRELERGDPKARNEAHRIAIGRAGEPGWKTVNEVRRDDNLPPVPGGDTLTNTETSNMRAVEAVQKVYLGVGKLITSDEARRLVNDATGADLPIPGPDLTPQPQTTGAPADAP